MRTALLLSLAWSSIALADVGPPRPRWHCAPPDTCQSCTTPDEACAAAAVDAGLTKADCHDTIGVGTNYYCPPGTTVGSYCGCSAIEAPVVAGLLGLIVLVRRRVRR